MRVTEEQIRAIVQQVFSELNVQALSYEEGFPASDHREGKADGIFPTIDQAVEAAAAAFHQWKVTPLEKRRVVIESIRATMRESAEMLARLAWEETRLGRWQDKIEKNLLVTNKTPGPEELHPLAWTGDHGLTLIERAPYGIVAAITPTTNPTSSIINNSISIISAGNAVVFNVHPNAKRCSVKSIQLINRAIQAAGGPTNLITCIAEPTIESAQALMRHPHIRLILVTGGSGVVQEAMRSGKRAICAGPGNPPVVVDETADIGKAGRDIVFGASFDNNIICVDEKEVIAVTAIADQLKKAMCSHGAIELQEHQIRRLEKVIFKQMGPPMKAGMVNEKMIGKNPSLILKEIGMMVGDEVRLILVEVPIEHSLIWTEQLMPVMPLVRVSSAEEAINLAIQAEHGFGHTASMFSKHLDHLDLMAREINCSIFVKNGPTLAGLGYGGEGYTSFSIASPTGEGVTSARCFTRERRCALVDHFRIV